MTGTQHDRTRIECDEAIDRLAEFDAIIDVRSPSEFADDHLPGAVSAPVLSDDERAEVGTLHRHAGAFDARRRGAVLVARNIARHVEQQFSAHGRDWRPLVYCWRGGQRSAALTHVLTRIGWRALQLEGGYRAFRRRVLAHTGQLPQQLRWIVIAGPTGSGKSRLLDHLVRAGAQVLDLERLACHRGSVLGGLPSQPQPSQRTFETNLWQALRHLDRARPVFVESESRKVGALRVPDALIDAIRASPGVSLDVPLIARVRTLRAEYAHFEQAPAALVGQLCCLEPLHGKARVAEWINLIDAGRWDSLVERLLTEHYDPAYQRSLRKNFNALSAAAQVALPEGTDDEYAALARRWADAPPAREYTPLTAG